MLTRAAAARQTRCGAAAADLPDRGLRRLADAPRRRARADRGGLRRRRAGHRRAVRGPRRRSVGAAAHAGAQRLPAHRARCCPSVPAPALQERWNGLSGAPLAQQSAAFYRLLRERSGAPARRRAGARLRLRLGPAHALPRPRRAARAPPRLRSGRVDPRRVPREPRAGDARASDFLPSGCRSTSRSTSRTRSPCSRTSRRRRTSACLAALHDGLSPADPRRHDPPARLPRRVPADGAGPRPPREPFVFAPHCADPSIRSTRAGDALRRDRDRAAVRARALGRWFELLHVDLLLGDLHQVVLTLRRGRDAAEAFWRALRARHPSLREALVADARVTARYRGERHEFRSRRDAARADAAARARSATRSSRRRSTALKARLQARGVPVLPRIAHRLAMVARAGLDRRPGRRRTPASTSSTGRS